MAKNVYHVTPQNDEWAVKKEGNERASSTHPTQGEGIEGARNLATEGDEIVIHRPDGTIREKITYSGEANGSENSSGGGSSSAKSTGIPASEVMSVGSRVSWGAIMAGTVVSLTVYITLVLLALAIGITAVDLTTIDGTDSGFAIGYAIVGVICLLASLYLGGMVTTFCTVGENKTEALIYGALLWAVFTGLLVGLGGVTGFGFGTMVRKAAPNTPGITSEDVQKELELSDAQMEKYDEKWGTVKYYFGPTTTAWIGFLGIVLSMFAAIAGAVTAAGPEFVLQQMRGGGVKVVEQT